MKLAPDQQCFVRKPVTNHANPTDLFDRKSQMDGHGFHKRSLMQFAGGRQLKTIEGFLTD